MAAAVAPAALVNGDILHLQCEDSALAACVGLPPHPLHTIEDGPQFVLCTVTHSATGTDAGPAAANAIRQIMATPAQYPTAFFAEPEIFVKPWRGNLLITTPTEAVSVDRTGQT
jgi:hypothetical protein